MKLFLISLVSLIGSSILLQAGCNKHTSEIDAPSCVQNKIRQIRSEPVRNPPAQVWKWEVDGQTYYYFTSPCCDQYNYLYDENCKVVCAPDGGFTGRGDGKCPVFKGEIRKTLVWKDDRKYPANN